MLSMQELPAKCAMAANFVLKHIRVFGEQIVTFNPMLHYHLYSFLSVKLPYQG
jgi:hypothetical protein